MDRVDEGGVGAAEGSMGGVGFVKADREEYGGGGRGRGRGRGMRMGFDGGCN